MEETTGITCPLALITRVDRQRFDDSHRTDVCLWANVAAGRGTRGTRVLVELTALTEGQANVCPALVVDATDAAPELIAHGFAGELLFLQTKTLARILRDKGNGVAGDDGVELDSLIYHSIKRKDPITGQRGRDADSVVKVFEVRDTKRQILDLGIGYQSVTQVVLVVDDESAAFVSLGAEDGTLTHDSRVIWI